VTSAFGTPPSFEDCQTFCRSWETDVGVCTAEWISFNNCQANLSAAGFVCDPDFGAFPAEGFCQAELDAINTCFAGL